jgi:hypothetical protein
MVYPNEDMDSVSWDLIEREISSLEVKTSSNSILGTAERTTAGQGEEGDESWGRGGGAGAGGRVWLWIGGGEGCGRWRPELGCVAWMS